MGALPGGRVRILVAAGVLLVAVVPRLWGLEDRCVWMDEDRQAGCSNGEIFAFDVCDKAAAQQQPPLDYHLENISIHNFGLTPTGIRLNAALLGSLAVLAFFLVASRFARSTAALAAGTLLMAFHPLLLFYSQEARPVSLAVLAAVLCAGAILSFFAGRGDREAWVRRALVLLAAEMAFLLSVGLQPIAFLGAACLAAAPGLLIRRYRARVLGLWAVTAVAVALYLPVAVNLLDNTRTIARVGGDLAGVLEGIASRWGEIRWGFVVEAHFRLFAPVLPLLAAAGLLCGIGWARGELGLETRFALASMSIFAVSFPFVFAVLYYTNAGKYEIVPPRYYLTMVPPVILLFTLAGDRALRVLSWLWARRRVLAGASLAVLLLCAAWAVWGTGRDLAVEMSTKRRDWRGLYELFSKEESGGVAYTLNFVGPGQWSPGFWSRRFYYPEEHRPVRLRGARQLAWNYRKARRFERNGAIYLVAVYGDRLVPDRALEGMPGVEFHRFHKLAVIRVAGRAGSRDRIFGVLTRLHDSIEQTPSKQILSGLVFQLAKIREDRPWIEESCRSLMSMEGKGWVADLQIKCGKSMGSSAEPT